jgi:uncharacterized protein YdeI (YjbR/CyaY-like superfamily)
MKATKTSAARKEKKSGTKQLQTLQFASSAELREWLEAHHGVYQGIWLRIFKKVSGEKSVNYAEALDQALCYGWIDGQKMPCDAKSWLQRLTPRRPRSAWSKINTQHVKRLTKAGSMAPSGLKVVETAKADGTWSAAYGSFRDAKPPPDFLKELAANKRAKAVFATLNKTNLFSIVYRLETARNPELRARRMKMILEMLENGKVFHP